jgi:NADPH:quinone reductase-like Zn-dependent oxidoreductase
MKAVIFNQYGEADVLQYQDVAEPTIQPDQLLLKAYGTSVNPVDWKIRSGQLQLLSGFNFPKSIGCDVSGVVVAIGEKVTEFKVGDLVYTFLNPLVGGAYAEYVAVPAATTARKPHNLSHSQAAAVPLAGLTALQALLDIGKIRAGQTVLINGASGGVGSFAVQIAKVLQTTVTGVCSTANLELVKQLGADVAIDYTQTDFTQQPIQYDVIFDAVGKQSFYSCQNLLKPDGIYISTLPTPDNLAAVAQTALFGGQKAKLILVQPNHRDLQALRAWIEADQVRVIVDKTYALSEMIQAHRQSQAGRTVGKIAINIEPE